MANQRQLISKFWKGTDIEPGHSVDLTISTVKLEEMGKEKEKKFVVHFDGCPKGLVMNAGHRIALIKLYGDFDENWVGKKITLYSEETKAPQGLARGVRILMKGEATFKGLPPEAEAFCFGA